MWKKGNPCALFVVQPLWRTLWRFLKKLKIELPYDSVITLLGIFPKEMKSLSQRGICTSMFIAPLFRIAQIWKQPKSVDTWIDKEIVIYKMEYYSAFKKEEILPFPATWMNLSNFVRYIVFSFIFQHLYYFEIIFNILLLHYIINN